MKSTSIRSRFKDGYRCALGDSSGVTGSLIAVATRSQPVSIAFAAYGAGMSEYNNFLSRVLRIHRDLDERANLLRDRTARQNELLVNDASDQGVATSRS